MIDGWDVFLQVVLVMGRFWPIWLILLGLALLGRLLRRAERRLEQRPRRTGRQAESRLERGMLDLIEEAGLPRPEPQYLVPAAGRKYRVDLAYPKLKLAIELDGRYHAAPDRRAWDEARDAALANRGWTTLRYTSQMLAAEPSRIVQELEQHGVKARRRRTAQDAREPVQ